VFAEDSLVPDMFQNCQLSTEPIRKKNTLVYGERALKSCLRFKLYNILKNLARFIGETHLSDCTVWKSPFIYRVSRQTDHSKCIQSREMTRIRVREDKWRKNNNAANILFIW